MTSLVINQSRLGLKPLHRYPQRPLQGIGNLHQTSFDWAISYRHRRTVLVAIAFHATAGYFNEIFSMHPDRNVIQASLLIALAIFVVLRERDFFFKRGLPRMVPADA